MTNYFTDLAEIDVSKHVEKKGQFSYLSWAYAVKELKSRHPDATWNVKRFNDLPYMKTDLGYFVEVEVSVNGVCHSQIHPVLNGRNQPIPEPSTFDINTSIQRALVKAIALHGLGLYIYAGEDLPEKAEPVKLTKKVKDDVYEQTVTCLAASDAPGLREIWEGFDSDEKVVLWGLFNSQQRSAMKKLQSEAT